MQEEYLQLQFIPSLQSYMIPVFYSSLPRSNAAVQMSQKLPHLNFPIGEGPKSSNIYGLANTGDGFNLGNLEYRQSVAENHPNVLLKFAYMKDLDNMEPFNIRRVDGGK